MKKLIRVCQLNKCLDQNVRFQGLRSQIKRSLLFVNEHLSSKRNEENGHVGQTLIIFFVLLVMLSCKERIIKPNIEHIRVSMPVIRFEKDIFEANFDKIAD